MKILSHKRQKTASQRCDGKHQRAEARPAKIAGCDVLRETDKMEILSHGDEDKLRPMSSRTETVVKVARDGGEFPRCGDREGRSQLKGVPWPATPHAGSFHETLFRFRP